MEKMLDLYQRKNGKLDVKAYQDYISELYININRKRNFVDIYGYLHRNIGYIGKSIEISNADTSKFILTISWLFSLANKLDINLLEALIKKFPGICPYCLQSHCICYHTNKKPMNPMSALEIKDQIYFQWEQIRGGLGNFNLDSAKNFITDIYPYNEVVWKTSGYHSHLLKIHQEMTEIHEAHSRLISKKKPLSAVMDEIADVFAWILSAWAILFPEKSIDKAFVDYYIEDCQICKQAPCVCGLSDSKSATLLDFEKIDILISCLTEMKIIFPKYDENFRKVLSTFSTISETQNMPIVSAAISDTKELLELIRRTITAMDPFGKSLEYFSRSLNIVNELLRIENRNGKYEKRIEVFISYSSKDRKEALILSELYAENDITYFMAEKCIEPASIWDEVIKSSLRGTNNFHVLVTPNSKISDWVMTETYSAEILEHTILPILFQLGETDIPDRLKKYQYVNFHETNKIIKAVRRN